jgi:Flp pilus assembly protein TadD
MRTGVIVAALAALSLAGCQKPGGGNGVSRAFDGVNVIDESNLNDIMLTVADPAEAVSYFERATAEQPDRIDLKRGLGMSLIRAGQPARAVPVWKQVVASREVTDQDRIDLADALIRSNDWDEAEKVLDTIPPTVETYERYRLEAMVADSNREWDKADSFYEIASGLTNRPASVLNNWGYSKLTRGDFRGAEQLFGQAIGYDPNLFTAKNNLILARGAQRNYQLPPIQTTQIERAQLLHTLALSAIKQGDITTGKSLLREAIETHPQHFEAAVRALRTLEQNGA